MDRDTKDYGRLNVSNSSPTASDVFEPASVNDAKLRTSVIEWLNATVPNLNLPVNASDEDLRTLLVDGTILCRLINRLRPGSDIQFGDPHHSSEAQAENVSKFLATMDEMGLPHFTISELQKGSMKIVSESLLTLKAHFMQKVGVSSPSATSPKTLGSDSLRWKPVDEHSGTSDSFPEDLSPRKFQRARSPAMSEATGAMMHHAGHKFHEVFQMKHGGYSDLPAAKISELMKSNSLDIAPTQSLLSMVNGILDESMGRKNGEIPHRVACLMRKVVQEIERRISTQAEHLRTQNNLFKTREEKYQSRIRVLEALANGTSGDPKVITLNNIHTSKYMYEEKKTTEDEDIDIKEKDSKSAEIEALKQELENVRKTNEDQKDEAVRKLQLDLEKKLKDVENHLTESKMKVEELEAKSRSNSQYWTKKEHIYKTFTEFQLGALKELKFASQSVRQEVLKTQKAYSQDFDHLGTKFKVLQDAAASYEEAVSENQKLHNEIQELKGNIRVYCRIRPFLPGQKDKQSTVDYIGENGELIVFNPSKPEKESRRSFKFNKVYGPHATQAEVYGDIQQLVQSVLDGYNVCIFAYGQTGSGKTYTMSGPDKGSQEEWGVNYRALNDLFRISQNRSTYKYEVGVQMVEIYNEQVRDLLASDTTPKRYPFIVNCFSLTQEYLLTVQTLGILSTASLAVPDANMREVNEPSDVLRVMETGFKNRARSSTSMNERSSRSHSVVTIHVHGTDLKNGGSVTAGLHLVDLAGSERIDRAEVVGDRLKEAQHINKSLAALGDVIFSLAQKSPHVPFRNSKLTQLLQASLGGQAKTLMLVQLNPEASSYAESLGTLKFAERVSGVELGPARSCKEASNVKDLMEQVASLKSTITKKDEEIERLQVIKDKKNAHPPSAGQRSSRYGSASPNSKAGNKQRAESILSDNTYLSVRTDTDSSLESSPSREGSKSTHSANKPKSGNRLSRPLSKISKDLPKAAKGMFKSSSGDSLTGKSSSKKWS
ncbi:hypothetical protein SSX86_008830 [Deinandra increscens subsp. villosa]|uniref:Kinesin-like protein n=1 Tax=Deinandra increscens subsp. villosa TaxID=3103831 RepID=A0AAP0DDE3_9ASTR